MRAGYDETVRNSWIRVLLSAVLFGLVLYFVRAHKQGRADLPFSRSSPSKPLLPSTAADGTERFKWVPRFPNAQVENVRTGRTSQQASYGYRFHTEQDQAAVFSYYETQLRTAGFSVVAKLGNPKDEDGALHAENPDRKRILDVTTAKVPTGLEIGVAAVER